MPRPRGEPGVSVPAKVAKLCVFQTGSSVARRLLDDFFVRSNLAIANENHAVRVLRDIHFVCDENDGVPLPVQIRE